MRIQASTRSTKGQPFSFSLLTPLLLHSLLSHLPSTAHTKGARPFDTHRLQLQTPPSRPSPSRLHLPSLPLPSHLLPPPLPPTASRLTLPFNTLPTLYFKLNHVQDQPSVVREDQALCDLPSDGCLLETDGHVRYKNNASPHSSVHTYIAIYFQATNLLTRVAFVLFVILTSQARTLRKEPSSRPVSSFRRNYLSVLPTELRSLRNCLITSATCPLSSASRIGMPSPSRYSPKPRPFFFFFFTLRNITFFSNYRLTMMLNKKTNLSFIFTSNVCGITGSGRVSKQGDDPCPQGSRQEPEQAVRDAGPARELAQPGHA